MCRRGPLWQLWLQTVGLIGGWDTSFDALAVVQGEVMVSQMRLVAAEVTQLVGFGTYFEARPGRRGRESIKDCGTLDKLGGSDSVGKSPRNSSQAGSGRRAVGLCTVFLLRAGFRAAGWALGCIAVVGGSTAVVRPAGSRARLPGSASCVPPLTV